MNNVRFLDWLKKHDACSPGVTWVGDRDARTIWNECKRADWLLWWVEEACVERAKLVRCACRIARDVLPLVLPGEDQLRLAIEAEERWCENPTKENESEATMAAIAAKAAKVSAWAATESSVVAARVAAHKRYCIIVREEITFDEVLKGMESGASGERP